MQFIMNFAIKEKQPLTWRAWDGVAWNSVGVVGLCLKFTNVKLQGPNKSLNHQKNVPESVLLSDLALSYWNVFKLSKYPEQYWKKW